MTDLLTILANIAFWEALLRIATPLILGTLGVLLCERAGVLNLGIEGIMVAGAFSGWLAVYSGLPLWGGVLVAALTGAVFGLLHAFLTVGPGHYPAGHGTELFRLPGVVPQGGDTAHHHPVRAHGLAAHSHSGCTDRHDPAGPAAGAPRRPVGAQPARRTAAAPCA